MSGERRQPTYIPEDVAVAEWNVSGKVGGGHVRVVDGEQAGEQSTSPTTTPPDPLSLLTGALSPTEDTSLSFVVRAALDDLLLNVIQQLQHDLNHGPAQTRSKIASQFLPRIMRALDKEEDSGDRELERLREEMDKLNQEMLYGEPKLYIANSQTPDSDDLPQVDPITGQTQQQTQQQSA